jgi:hypothetical protein
MIIGVSRGMLTTPFVLAYLSGEVDPISKPGKIRPQPVIARNE